MASRLIRAIVVLFALAVAAEATPIVVAASQPEFNDRATPEGWVMTLQAVFGAVFVLLLIVSAGSGARAALHPDRRSARWQLVAGALAVLLCPVWLFWVFAVGAA